MTTAIDIIKAALEAMPSSITGSPIYDCDTKAMAENIADALAKWDREQTINGWKPPVMYDVTLDNYRIVTQGDVDRFLMLVGVYGTLCRSIDDLKKQRDAAAQELKSAK